MPDITEYEKSVITLIETVKNLKDSQNDFRLEVKQGFDELKNNWNARLSKVEEDLLNSDKVFAAKEVEDARDAKADARITKLEISRTRLNVLVSIATGLITILVGLILYSLFRIKV